MLINEVENFPEGLVEQELWNRERWWYKLVHVCQRWRYLILSSTSYLRLHLLCTYGTPVADMLAHSPPLPIIIEHFVRHYGITTKDKEGIVLALRHRDRVRSTRLGMPFWTLQGLIEAIEGEFPILECFCISSPAEDDAGLVLPKTFQAPLLRHLYLMNIAYPTKSPLLTTAINLSTLLFQDIVPSAHFHPNDLQRLPLMPQLETLGINFCSPVHDRNFEGQLLHTPIMTRATLPNLRWFGFRGVSADLEEFLPRMTAPFLRTLEIHFSNELTFSVPHLQQFVDTLECFRHHDAVLAFDEVVRVAVGSLEDAMLDQRLSVTIECSQHDQQLASAAQICNTLSAVFSEVEHLYLGYTKSLSSGWSNGARLTLWRELLRPFGKVKTLRVPFELVWVLSRSLQPEGEESPMELLPELKLLECFGSCVSGLARDAFVAFINSRQDAGHPVTWVHL